MLESPSKTFILLAFVTLNILHVHLNNTNGRYRLLQGAMHLAFLLEYGQYSGPTTHIQEQTSFKIIFQNIT